MIEVDPAVDALYATFKGKLRWDNLIPSCLEMARELEQMTHLKGAQRLELLQKTLRHAVLDSDKTVEEREGLLQFIDTVLPIAMQAAILASKIPIKQIHATCWKMCV